MGADLFLSIMEKLFADLEAMLKAAREAGQKFGPLFTAVEKQLPAAQSEWKELQAKLAAPAPTV